MPTDLVLRTVSTAEPGRVTARAAAPAIAVEAAPPVAAPATPNPRLRLDGSLGMVVLEFRGAGGEVANTIPSPRAIAAYRAAVISNAPVPVGVTPRDGSAPPPAPEPAHDAAAD